MKKSLFLTVATLLIFLCGCSAPIINESEEYLPTEDVALVQPQIEIYYQYPEYPAGCELASLCQVLRSYGYDVDIADLLNKYISVSNTDWVYSYYGDIYSGGFTFPPAICDTALRYLIDNYSRLHVTDISGVSWERCVNILNYGVPLIVWYTIDYESPRWYLPSQEGYQPWVNLHCIVIYDIDDEYVYIADPIEGYTTQEIDKFKSIWEECGSYAVLIAP